MSEAADTFDADFEAARDAERDTPAEIREEVDAGDQEEVAEEPPEKSEADIRAEKAEKKAADLQKALKAERGKRQAQDARLDALEKGATKASEKPPTPAELAKLLRDDDDDPIGDIQTVKKLARLLVGNDEAETQAEAQTRQRTEAMNSIGSTMKEYEDDFKELHPDYADAAKHFMEARAEELRETGLDGQALATAMQNDFAGIVSRSVAAGKDPAEIIYNMAARRGFKAGADATNTKLDTIAKGQEQARTLAGGGSTNTGSLSASKIADLRGAAFDAAFEKLRATERRR